ncbi:MAG: hypothetical protein AAF434_20375 [Pseudomonadota bacterium]
MFLRRRQILQAGISIEGQRLSVVVVSRANNQIGELVAASSYALGESGSVDDALAAACNEHKLSKAACVYVMESNSYSLLQVESPNVAADETLAALRWKVKDLIDFHIDDATIDTYPMPASNRSGATGMMSVVVTKTSSIQERVDLMHKHEIEPTAIDINELALNNISRVTFKTDDKPSAVMYLLPESMVIQIADGTEMFLSRSIESNTNLAATEPANRDADAWSLVPEAESDFDLVSLEMQRSMDYYESHYGRGPADEMRFFQQLDQNGAFIDFARQQLPFRLTPGELEDHIEGVDQIEHATLPFFLPALGGALRANVQ